MKKKLIFLLLLPGLCKAVQDFFLLRTAQQPIGCLLNDRDKSVLWCDITPPAKEEPKSVVLSSKKLKVNALFFDRGSDKIVICGQPFPAGKESMMTFVRMFKEYDVLLFDYRWERGTYVFHPATLVSPFKRIVLNASHEVTAAVDWARSRKNYTAIAGVCECYSSAPFLKAQAEAEAKDLSLFTHLILDSCWRSLSAFARQLATDPYLSFNPFDGGSPRWLQSLLACSFLKKTVNFFITTFTPEVGPELYIKNISIPLFFIHGSHDLLVPLCDVEVVWQACRSPHKIMMITPYRHCDNVRHCKKLYKKMCSLFIENKPIDGCFFSKPS